MVLLGKSRCTVPVVVGRQIACHLPGVVREIALIDGRPERAAHDARGAAAIMATAIP